ncbi:MAG: acyl-CoA dehydrogenase family protein, partial [Alphaproteobacteria bacterium]
KVFVPAERTTLRDDPDGRKIEAPLYNFPAMSMFALGFGSVALGIAQGFLGDFLAFAQGKRPRLAKSTIADSQVAQAETALASARIMASRAFLHQEAEQVWAETQASGVLSVTGRARIRLASTFAIHEAKAAVDALYD